ncbi:MAG: cytochrome-c peroxidase [Chthonomonadales bacterium]|nr:cytochrome-c peroxidase [Chthonomonadales bacterium]
MRILTLGIAAFGVLLWLAHGNPSAADGAMFANGLLPPVPVPADNPMDAAKVELGKQLYFDTRLSKDSTTSCATCHSPDHGWADPKPVSEGVGRQKGGRNAPTVLNSAYMPLQFWDGRAATLEEQALGPIQNPVEMAMTMVEALDRIKAIPGYVEAFRRIFGTEPTEEGVAKAIAAFERTVISTDSPYDRYVRGNRSAMSPSAVRGMNLFNGKAHCTPCHSGPNFSDGDFHNLGVGYAAGRYADKGRFDVTKNPADLGKFKTPGLRSIALTAPYLHDGSERTLADVIEFYDRGGNPNPNLDPLMLPLHLTAQEKADLVAFLEALTGEPVKITPPTLPPAAGGK